MNKVHLCLDKECRAESRFIEDLREITSKTGLHSGHECQDLTFLQSNLKPLVEHWDSNKIETILSKLDEQCAALQKACQQLISEYFAAFKKQITNFQSETDIQANKLVDAIKEENFQYLKENQQFYQILLSPELFMNNQQSKLEATKQQVSELYDLMGYKLNDEVFKINIQQSFEQKSRVQNKGKRKICLIKQRPLQQMNNSMYDTQQIQQFFE